MSAPASAPARRRLQVRVSGTVQGVGFRPYAYRLARELGCGGYVLNDGRGVLIEVEGAHHAVAAFLARLGREAPPLAVLEEVAARELAPRGAESFDIRDSPRGQAPRAPVTPDTATCEECLRELFDPSDRRYRYPFINCTNCGPRFTIVTEIPYDRTSTTMAAFEMCRACRAEYEDPLDRRFHAQPNACPACGPAVSLLDARARRAAAIDEDAVAVAAGALRAGAIIAVKGIGGFHLACRADDEKTVRALRARKHREDKPFAVMVADINQAQELVCLGKEELDLLLGPQRPIVLCERRPGAELAGAVAPGAPELGVMLAYSPLHQLLLADAGMPLVMTSGNVSDEPIAYRDADAFSQLGAIADLFLVHDRAIETRTDDSVVRVVHSAGKRRTIFIRRSRGHVPSSISLPGGTDRPLLGCGAELKNTFCLALGERAWVGHHIGDLQNYETLCSFSAGIEHFKRLLAVEPALVAHDCHPEYLSTKYALECEGVELVPVQHHHAHLAACLAEHGLQGPALGVIYDGAGLGTDGTVWGGELLYGDVSRCERVGKLLPVQLPGGEQAVRQPWRMACAWLSATRQAPVCDVPARLASSVGAREWRAVGELLRTGVASPLTSSVGRLFDAIAALCGIRAVINYEGQAAIELERACDRAESGCYPFEVLMDGDGSLVLDPRQTVDAVMHDVAGGASVGTIAARFHAALATGTVAACVTAAERCGSGLVVLSGGVFQNRLLLELVGAGLAATGLRVLIPERLPPGDGGISYGQVAVAARQTGG